MCLSLLLTYSREQRSFQHLGVWSRGTGQVNDGVVPEEVTTLNVTAGTLRAIGVQPAIGRGFSEADQSPGALETVILMDGYWGRRFGRDPAIIGREVAIDSRPRVVVGVMPAGFRFLDETPDLVLPVRIDPATLTLGGYSYEGLARLAPGVTVEQARADIARMLPGWLGEWPSWPGVDRSAFSRMTPLVRPLKEELVGSVGNMLWVLMGTIGIVLVIACANVANLVLVRAQDRQHELALRTALGAGRARLARQLLVENLVLGLLGGALGLLLALVGLRVLSAIGGASIPRLHEITLDPTVLAFTLGLSLSTALLFREHSLGEGGQRAACPDASGRWARFERQSGAQPGAKRPGRGSGRARAHSARRVGADGSDVSRVTSRAARLHRPEPRAVGTRQHSGGRTPPIPRAYCDCSARCSNGLRRSRA